MASYMLSRRVVFLRTAVNFARMFALDNKTAVSVKEALRDQPMESDIIVKGWIHAIRKQKDNVFFDVSDGSCLGRLQVVTDVSEMVSIRQLTFGTCVEVHGRLVRSIHPAQPVELRPSNVVVLGSCPLDDYPFEPRKMYPADYTRQFPHLRSKTRTFAAMLRARNAAVIAMHEFFQSRKFVSVNAPVITSNDCEGAGQVFTVMPLTEKKLGNEIDPQTDRYFDKEAYLTVSSQLHLEAVAAGIANVYAFGPCFRAENSKSRHHLAEFYMLEAEMAFVLTIEQLLTVVEDLLKWTTKLVHDRCLDDVTFLRENDSRQNSGDDEVHKLLENNFIRLTYDEALVILEAYKDAPSLKWGQDLARVHEQRIVKHCGNVPVFVTRFPSSIKPFYAKASESSKETVEAFDLLVPVVGELCGGSLRENDFDTMKERLERLKLLETLQWYLDLRKFGSCPHGGFGLGFDRYIQFTLGVNSIKDTVPFPCYPHHCPY